MQRVAWPIHEDRFLAGVTMDVNKATYRLQLLWLVIDFPQEFFNVENCGVEFGVRRQESSVKIISRKWGSIVANNDTVWVTHRHDFKHNSPSEINCFRTVAGDKAEESFHNERSWCLTRVDSSTKDNVLFEFLGRVKPAAISEIICFNLYRGTWPTDFTDVACDGENRYWQTT